MAMTVNDEVALLQHTLASSFLTVLRPQPHHLGSNSDLEAFQCLERKTDTSVGGECEVKRWRKIDESFDKETAVAGRN